MLNIKRKPGAGAAMCGAIAPHGRTTYRSPPLYKAPFYAVLALLLSALALLGGCMTTAEKYAASKNIARIGDHYFRLTVGEDVVLEHSMLEDFVLLGVAETTLQNGFTHFLIVDAQDKEKRTSYSTFGQSNTHCEEYQRSENCYTTYIPPTTQEIVNPIKQVYFYTFKESAFPDDVDPRQLQNALEVWRYLSPRVLVDEY